MTTLSDLGTATTNHVAFQVRKGMMNGAVHFFKQIGFLELEDRKVVGDWGQARFLVSGRLNHSVIQLTELACDDSEKLEMTENHLAIHFTHFSPKEAAEVILDWAAHAGAGESASIEAADAQGTKWFVYLPALFKFALEIV